MKSSFKKDFPIFKNNPGLVYLDSTASSLKPQIVIDKLREYYENYTSNIFRGLYPLSLKATEEYEETRQVTARFINAPSEKEIIFTRNTSESLNLVAYSLSQSLQPKDEILCSIAEHHSNFVPWQQFCLQKKAIFKTIDLNDESTLDLEDLKTKLSPKTKIVALTHISNVLGTINPIEKIVAEIKKINPQTLIILDAAQSAPHLKIDIQKLGVDFLAFSSHKMLGPTSVGILWGKMEHLKKMPPFMFGGEMILNVTKEKTIFAESPHKFEAGTPSIGEVIAFKAAIQYLEKIGFNKIGSHEKELTRYAMEKMKTEFGSQILFFGPKNPDQKTGIISFLFKNYHPHDISEILGSENICVRAGQHCAQPLHKYLDTIATTRASFYIYNDQEDVDKLIKSLKKVDQILKGKPQKNHQDKGCSK